MFRRFLGGSKTKDESPLSTEISLLAADYAVNGDPFLPGTKSASRDAYDSQKSYVTTDILGGGFSGYGAAVSGKSDIRANKYGAAFVILCNIAAQRCVDARMGEVGAANWTIVTSSRNEKGETVDEPVASNTDYEDNAIARAIVRYQQKYSEPLFARWEQSLCVAGENYIELVTNRHHLPSDIEWLNPLFTDIDAPMNQIRGYRYHGEGAFETFKPYQIAYDREPSNLFTDVYGHSPLMTGTHTASIVINSGRTLAAWFRNGAVPGAVARPKLNEGKQSWTPEEGAILRQFIADNHKGVDNAFRMALLSLPMDIEVFDLPDLQKWAEMIKTLESEIYTAFGVPRSIAGDSDTTRYQSSPMDEPKFKRLISRRLSRIQDSFNTSIVPFFDRSGRYRLEFDLSDFEVVPPETVAVAKDQLGAGIITLNESRQLLGLKELENGDVFYLPASSIVVPREQLAVIQSKPTYLPFGNPQATVEQATEMAQSAGINTPNAPIPTQPAPNLTTEEIDPDAESAEDLQNPTLPTQPIDPTKEAGEKLFIGFSLSGNPDVISLQRAVMELVTDAEVKWTTPNDYHVTLLVAPTADELDAKAFLEAVKELPIPELRLKLGSLHAFDRMGKHALTSLIRRNQELLDYQAQVYDLAAEFGIECESMYTPTEYKPHVTLAYAPEHMRQVTYQGKVTVTPKGVNCDYGDTPLWRSWETDEPTPPEETPTDDTEAAKDEFKAWLKYQKNNAGKANKRPFTFEVVPAAFAETVVKCLAFGESADSIYNRLACVAANTLPAELPEVTQAYKAALEGFGLTDAEHAVKAHAHGVLLAKAITDTRSRFEAELTRQMLRAYNEKVKRSTFERNMSVLLFKYAEKALIDGFADAGYEDFDIDDTEDDEANDARQWLNGFLDDQTRYISNVADVLYADDAITEDEVRDTKGELWFTGSVLPAYNYALTTASKNARLKWVYDPAKEHCGSCEALNGIVLTAKRWQSEGIEPGSRELDCWGGRCGCKFVPTNEKKHRGKLPQWKFKAHIH